MEFVIAGLGNPGSGYEHNRHNVGFMFVDYFASRYNLNWSRSKWDGLVIRTSLWGERVCLVKPDTYMNRSGRSVTGTAHYYHVESEQIVVVHDDIDMNPGRIKLVKGGGAGGHNGIRSIVQHLGTNNFYRLKIGIGRPGNSDAHPEMPVEKFVLSDFSEEEYSLIMERITLAEEGMKLLIEGDDKKAMSYLNCIK